MIRVDSLTRVFGETFALKKVSFEVLAGEIVGFLGPNGAGKTTAMKILTCTLAPSSGTAAIAGHDVTTEAMAVRRQVGFMPEHVPLYLDNSVHDFLRFVGHLKRVPDADFESQITGIEERTGLREVRNRLVGHLSKGYRQRVGLAQALVGDPPILILDEPSAGLDPQQTVEIREMIRDFRGRKTVLLSSHILNEISQICERVLILNRGRLVAEESPGVLARRYQSQAHVELAWEDRREDVLAALARVAGVASVVPTALGAEIILDGDPREVRPLLAAAVQTAGGRLQNMIDRTPSLEDLFLRLTGSQQEDLP
jgi:ABC-2 type transport system ATP-binding protein